MRAKLVVVALMVLAGLGLCLIYPRVVARAQGDGPVWLAPNVPVQGSLTNRFGEEWSLTGCAGEVMTASIKSAAFAPNLELYPPVGRDSVASTRNTSQRSVQLAGITLPENGAYTLVALGSSVRDRGAYSLTVVMSSTATLPPDLDLLAPGETMTGTVSNRDGEEWGFYGCAADVITLTMQSTGTAGNNPLSPLLELYGPAGRKPITTSAAGGTGAATSNRSAGIAAFALPETGYYTVLALGQSVRDRGPYSLRLLVTTVTAPAATPTPTQTPTPKPSEAMCTVVSTGGLRVRSGPGQVYPATGGLQYNAQLRPRGRDARGVWLQVEQIGGTVRGWVSAGAQYVRCNIAISSVALAPIPPVPTAMPTPTPTPTPAPVVVAPGLPQPEGVLIRGPGEPGDMQGNIYVPRQSLAGERDGSPVFRSPFFFEMYVFDPAKGKGTGAGIDHVTFTISCPNGESYTRTERNARYCVFGGGEPNCNAINLDPGGSLPGSQCSIEDGAYSASIEVVPSDDRRNGGNWNFNFFLDLSGR